jgi:hypothetical protein
MLGITISANKYANKTDLLIIDLTIIAQSNENEDNHDLYFD